MIVHPKTPVSEIMEWLERHKYRKVIGCQFIAPDGKVFEIPVTFLEIGDGIGLQMRWNHGQESWDQHQIGFIADNITQIAGELQEKLASLSSQQARFLAAMSLFTSIRWELKKED